MSATVNKLELRLHCQRERGQVLILFVGIFSLLIVFAALAIDQGLWMNHRRVAQKDADAAARAGAAQYLKDLAAYNAASRAAATLADANGAPALLSPATFNATDGACLNTNNTDSTCARTDCPTTNGSIPGAPSVEIAVPRPAPGLFTRVGLVLFKGDTSKAAASGIGARSTACVGSVTSVSPGPSQFIPLTLHYNYPAPPDACFVGTTPQIGQRCIIATKQNSIIQLPVSGACEGGSGNPNAAEDMIRYGLNSTGFNCSVNDCTPDGTGRCAPSACPAGNATDCVADRNGALGQNDVTGFENRIKDAEANTSTSCGNSLDALTNFRATFSRVDEKPVGGPPGLGGTDPADTLYQQNPCNNGRVAFVFVSDAIGGGSNNPVKAFASVFIIGCSSDSPTDYAFNRCDSVSAFGNVYVTGVLLRVVMSDQAAGDIGPVDNTSPLAIETTR